MNPDTGTTTTKARIGERLINAGHITRKQLDIALEERKRVDEPLGQILVNLGFLDQEGLARALAEDLNVPFVRLNDLEIDSNLAVEVDEAFAREHLFVPIRRESDGRITVAMADAADIGTIDAIQNRLKKNIDILAATQEDILNAISGAFKGSRAAPEDPARKFDSEHKSFSAIEKAEEIIAKAFANRATDIHIEPEEKLLRIRYRMDGILQPGDTLPRDMTSAVVTRFKIISDMDITETRLPQDGRFTRKKGPMTVDFRVSSMPTAYGENIVIRLLDRSSVNLDLQSLGVDAEARERIARVAEMSHGMFLVSGPTGSGKTTTLYALILLIDAMARKVVTIEDPIEYKLPLIRQSQVDSEIGYTFAGGLRTILRQDPDVILVGEIRDPETADIAVKSSMTGHMVFSSVHANTSIGAVQRLLDLGIERYLLASTLTGALGQRLVRTICPKCRETYEPSPAESRWLGDEGAGAVLARGKGCPACHGTGYKGRTVIYELFIMDRDFEDLITRKGTVQDFEALARKKNMPFLIDQGRRKVIDGITTMSEVLRVCNDVGN